MRPPFALLALLASTPALAVPALELELSGGVQGHATVASIAPALGGRVGLDLWDVLTVSIRAMSLSRFDAPTQEVGLLADVHVHNPGRFQFSGGVALGVAIATFTPAGDGVDAAYSVVRPFPLLDVGVRLNLWKFFVGLNVGGWPFTPNWVGTLSFGISLFGD